MKKLMVFYDSECPLCQRCRAWAGAQPSYFPVEFWPLQAKETREQFPDLDRYDPGKDLVAFSDEGAVYRGTNAWLVILWALPNWRKWSLRLAQPAWRPFVHKFWNWISANRLDMLPGTTGAETKMRRILQQLPDPGCRLPHPGKETPK